jgi:hypothetical protein
MANHFIADRLLRSADHNLMAARCVRVTLETTDPLKRAIGFEDYILVLLPIVGQSPRRFMCDLEQSSVCRICQDSDFILILILCE